MIVVGIDPGITGAIGVLKDGAFASVEDLPVMANGRRNQIDAAGVDDLLRQVRTVWPHESFAVVMEQVSAMPGQGVSSMFSLGDSFGALRAVVACRRLALDLVTPAKWKRDMGISKDKDFARAKAIQLFPDASVVLSRKKDHNRAEALLLALWLHRKMH